MRYEGNMAYTKVKSIILLTTDTRKRPFIKNVSLKRIFTVDESK